MLLYNLYSHIREAELELQLFLFSALDSEQPFHILQQHGHGGDIL
jgi:hypothetical protein